METLLIIATAVTGVAALTVILALLGIVLIELLPEHVRRLKAWLRSFKPRHRLPTGGGRPLMVA